MRINHRWGIFAAKRNKRPAFAAFWGASNPGSSNAAEDECPGSDPFVEIVLIFSKRF
jgi:hypothetical protein